MKNQFQSRTLLLLFVLFFMQEISAQNMIRCYSTEVSEYREQISPGYQQAVKQTFEQARLFAQSQGFDKSDPVYRIPVVVHVVYKSANENIHDSLIHKQIQVLNEDFRRMNADQSNTRPEFMPIAADTRIEFFLATTDPDGNPTTGITRTQGNPFLGIFDPFTDNVKISANGGKDPWPPSKYLNIWVCDLMLGLGVLGYAYPPVGAPNWPADELPTDSTVDGVVIHYPVFGPGNPAASGPLAIVNRGRTLTHEVGHYLGLRHIWGDGDCTQDDGITDTPNADDNANQICDWTKNTCTETSGPELPDNIENYMDYAADSCMNMFTEGQAVLMRTVLENYRSQLYETSSTSVENISVQEIQAYPNPAVHNVHITLPSAASTLHSQILIRDIAGRNVIQKETQPGIQYFQIDVSNLPAGAYVGTIGSYYFKFFVQNQ